MKDFYTELCGEEHGNVRKGGAVVLGLLERVILNSV